MSGKRLDDHSFMFGSGNQSSPFPKGAHEKVYPAADGAGRVGTEYPDTYEKVRSDQDGAARTTKKHSQKDGFRYK